MVVRAVVTTSMSRPTISAATDVSASTHRCAGAVEALVPLVSTWPSGEPVPGAGPGTFTGMYRAARRN